MPIATVPSKGQITIPEAVREALELKSGDRVAFRLRADGVVEVQAETSDVMALKGALKARRRGVTLEDMEKAIAEGASDDRG